MFQTLTIENFQAHEKLKVELDPHVTTIVGPSDVGKSAVIRALIWLATNKPSGNTFIREGSDKAIVILTVDGIDIVRTRGKGVNEYSRGGNVYKAFGNEVPEDIVDLLNIGLVNIQGQHDAPFWFSETPGEVSRQLNAIVNLGIIDDTLANLASMLRESRTASRVIEGQLQTAKEKRSAWAWAKSAEKRLGEVEQAQEKHRTAHEQRLSLQQWVRAIGKYSQRRRALQRILRGLSKVQGKAEIREELGIRIAGLSALIFRAIEAKKTASLPVPTVGPLVELAANADRTRETREALSRCIEDTRICQDGAYNLKSAHVYAKKEYDEQMKGACPLCGRS